MELAQEGEQEVQDQGDPYLCHHSISTGPQEAFDLQVLFDPLEEELYLPAGFIDIGDLQGVQVVDIGEIEVGLATLSVHVPDSAEFDGKDLCMGTRESDGLVGGNP